MSWRLRIRHTTTYEYDAVVHASYNEARITPLSTPAQMTVDARVETNPSTRPLRYWDYWGALVHAFDVQEPHERLTVTSTALVETNPLALPAAADTTWGEIRSAHVTDEQAEYLAPSVHVPVTGALADIAQELLSAADTPGAAVDAVCSYVHHRLTYEPGATTVSTSADEAWAAGGGVCQDFAHVTIGVLRAMGIPARYVSGYLHPIETAEMGETVRGESHAWVEAWTGAWRPIDPTSGAEVANRHVVVARARDYRDVSPLRGIYTGAATARQHVTVELTRVA